VTDPPQHSPDSPRQQVAESTGPRLAAVTRSSMHRGASRSIVRAGECAIAHPRRRASAWFCTTGPELCLWFADGSSSRAGTIHAPPRRRVRPVRSMINSSAREPTGWAYTQE
jgi:hypothetical protein